VIKKLLYSPNYFDYLSKKLFLVLLITISLLGCTIKKTENPIIKDKKLVLTTFTVLADLAKNIAGQRIEIVSITKPGAEIHGYQFTPSDLVKASGADLIIENGLGLESWMNKFTASAGNIPRVVLSNGMKPLLIEGDIYAGKPNPHAWMSPKRTIHYVDRMVEAFIDLDPAGEQLYKTNAKIYKTKLEKLDMELRKALDLVPLERRLLVTCEGAFTYLANDYGLEEAYLWPVNAESQVTPKRMSNLIAKVKERSIPAVFCESTVSAKPQLEVARATGARFGGTFFVDSLSEADGPAATLLDLQRHNVRLIREGLAYDLGDE
tara:strand:- start:1571 stop:2533 length:963 start_codon:yes stop_codon:yes gene_type:complete